MTYILNIIILYYFTYSYFHELSRLLISVER